MKPYDVAVIGGGPAGMMAAGRAAELGAKVVLLEKNAKLGKKLLITGGGRCNITNAEFDIRRMVLKYGVKGKALFGAFTRFGVQETLDFFHEKGLQTKIEAEKRAFPKSDKAEDVWRVMVEHIKEMGVAVRTSSPIRGFRVEGNRIAAVQLERGEVVADRYILATGGKSRPETGSTGEGFQFLKALGHTVDDSDPALVPIKIQEEWIRKFSGTTFKHAGLTVFQYEKKQERRVGSMLITHFGLSGPLVLNMSKNISELFKHGPVRLEIDMFPDLDLSALNKKVVESLGPVMNKQVRNAFGDIVPPKMVSMLIVHAHVDPEKEVHSLTKAERLSILKLLKGIPLTVSGFLGTEKAVVTSGGVSLKEIDFKTMRSKLIQNLFLAGDILDFDRPSGGFSLQICWTTGFLAGDNAAR